LISEQVPRARKIVIPNVGHMSNMEAPGEVNQVIIEFLELCQSEQNRDKADAKDKLNDN